jgi:hypothetical protein
MVQLSLFLRLRESADDTRRFIEDLRAEFRRKGRDHGRP